MNRSKIEVNISFRIMLKRVCRFRVAVSDSSQNFPFPELELASLPICNKSVAPSFLENRIEISIEKVLQLGNISTKLVLGLGATYYRVSPIIRQGLY